LKKITLTADQNAVLHDFSAFLFDKNEKYLIIQGPAGSGKSTLIRYMNKHMEAQLKMYQLLLQTDKTQSEFETIFTATTNKAADVLNELTGMKAVTVHSLMNLTLTYNLQTGKPKIIKKRGYALLYNKLIVIDEASMISDELFRVIDETTMDCKIVLIGDCYQLAPVKQKESIMKTLPCKTSYMSMILRNSGVIMQAGAQFRDTVETGIFQSIPDDPRLKHVDGPTFQAKIDEAFTDKKYSLNSAKVLAWQNTRVRAYNAHIRKVRGLPEAIAQGETMYTNRPIFVGKHKWTGDSPVKITHVGDTQILEDVSGRMVELDKKASCFLPDNPFEAEHKLKALAKQNNWALHYALKETWLDLRPAYASTVHKAQGSTYDTVFIDLSDIGLCHIWSDVARMCYVAISRAAKQVYLYGKLPPKYCAQA